MSPPKPTVRIPKAKPATIAEISVIEFRAIKLFRGLSQHKRLTKSHALVDGVRPMAVAAAEVLAMTKEELIEKVDEGHDLFGPMLKWLSNAGTDAQAIVDVIRAAESRLAIALANVEGETSAVVRKH
jgi:hypothetical protein